MLADDAAVPPSPWRKRHHRTICRKGAIHLSMSTISVALSKRSPQAHAQAGQRYVAAPVFGRPDMAAAGQAVHRRRGRSRGDRGLRAAVARDGTERRSLIGTEPAAANLVKLSGNFLPAAAIEAMGEAVALIGKAGIDRRAYIDLLTSTVFNAAPYTRPTVRSSPRASSSQPPSPHRSDTRTSAWRWPQPRLCACRCRWEACCMIVFCACSSSGGEHLDWAAIGGLATQDAGGARVVTTLPGCRHPHARHSPHRAEPALHVCRGGPADFPHRHARRTAHAGRYFSEHQHPDHRRRLSVPGLAARPDGGAHHHPVRARADDDGQRYRAHRGEFLYHLRHRQDLLPPVGQYRHRQRAGHRDLADACSSRCRPARRRR